MKKKKLYLIVVGILLVIALLTGVSYALWMKTFSQTGNNAVASDCFNISFVEDTTSNIKLENSFPTRDNEGMNLKPYTFSVTNKCSNEVSYEINLETTTNTTMKDNYVKVMMGENSPKLLTSYVNGNKTLSNGKSSYVLESGNLSGNTTNDYKIRIWMDENVTQDMENAMNSVFESKITVTGTYIKNYHESILNGTDPVIKDNLIPVTISDDGTVRKADIRQEWYNYQNKNWANAVILKDENEAVDYSGNNRNGRIYGTTYNNEGLVFDGEDDCIEIGNQLKDLFKTSNTIELRIKFDEANARDIIIGNYDNLHAINYEKYLDDLYRVYFNDCEKDSYTSIYKTPIHEFVTLSYVYDQANNKIHFYINGNYAEDFEAANYPYDWINVRIGQDNRVDVTNLKGTISSVRVYDRGLSETEIKNNMNAAKKEEYVKTNLMLLYDFTVPNDKNFEVGDVIPESNIESYFVWIPRYKYQIFNEGNYSGLTNVENKVQDIKVIFENKNTTPSNGSTVGSWLTHPAFTSFDTNGLWVGKYETGYKGATTTTEAEQNVNDSSKLQIKPNVYSWRGIQVSNAHLNSYNYQRNLDSHMMKNAEWGAVAYLLHSNYGSKQSVRVNNNSSYITGYAALNEPTCGYTNSNETCNQYGTTNDITQPYSSTTGYLASTTGNISGVYDMSGGSWEYVMGIMLDKNGNPMSGRNNLYNSGFNGTFGCPNCDSDTSGKTSKTDGINFPEKKYYETYTFLENDYAENDKNYRNRIAGDATGEFGPFNIATYGTKNRQIGSWYKDEAWFVYSWNPWFRRGAGSCSGSDAGSYAFNNTTGQKRNDVSFRIVLAF